MSMLRMRSVNFCSRSISPIWFTSQPRPSTTMREVRVPRVAGQRPAKQLERLSDAMPQPVL